MIKTEPAAPYEEATELLPIYSPSPSLPNSKRTEVTRAPTQTSCHSILVFGKKRYIAANRTVVTLIERAKLTACKSNSGAGRKPPKYFPSPATAALATSDCQKKADTEQHTNERMFFLMYSLTSLFLTAMSALPATLCPVLISSIIGSGIVEGGSLDGKLSANVWF